jgi:hypothetical protein
MTKRVSTAILHIGDESTEVWDLQGCAVPPIVLLAACETAAIAETYNTPAVGWLALGARSVRATYFPIQADLTLVLFGRIFANLMEAITGDEALESWEAVVSKTIFLKRYLDFYYGYLRWAERKRLPLPPRGVSLEYTFLWNRRVSSLADGVRETPDILAKALDHFGPEFAESFRRYLAEESTVPHTMFFSHLGASETIKILKERKKNHDTDSPALRYWRKRSAEIGGSV